MAPFDPNRADIEQQMEDDNGAVVLEDQNLVSGGMIDNDCPLAELSAKEMRNPPARTGPEQVRKHNLLHLPYAAWCPTCVMAKGKDDHHNVSKGATDRKIPSVQVDYLFCSS